MDEKPTCIMMHPTGGVVGVQGGLVPMYASVFLDVNMEGERYINEYQLLPYVVSPRLRQNDDVSFQVWDGDWETQAF